MRRRNSQTHDSGLQARVAAFQRDGYVVIPALCPEALCDALRTEVEASLHPVLGPAEFEADVGYPGAPPHREATGGDTPRRLLHAYTRFPVLRPWLTGDSVRDHLRLMLNSEAIALSQCHHNCIMTKYPAYSSITRWHQDVRYWSFQRPDLVSLWVALGDEHLENGALRVIPGTHNQTFAAEQLDEELFLRAETSENRQLIERAVTVELSRGDVLFFHCRTLHAAGENRTDIVKLSGVFTYHDQANKPLPGTRSAQYPSIRF